MSISACIRSLLNGGDQKILSKLRGARKVQDFLDTLPVNFEVGGETYMSPRRVLETRTAHCFEGALLAAAAFAYHGQKPLLMDMQTSPEDEDHVVALYRVNGLWGAVSKTNHAILRYRDPVYRTVRELAMSYFHEYVYWKDGKKTLRAYSGPIDLSRFKPEEWVSAQEDLYWLVEYVGNVRHFPIAPKNNLRLLRPASKIERDMLKYTEWSDPRPEEKQK